MSQVSPILRKDEGDRLVFRCPGCNGLHSIPYGSGPGARWTWNGDAHKPTFTPSILVRTIRPDLSEEDWERYDDLVARAGGTEAAMNDPRFRYVCHSFVTDGRIRFLEDCTHGLTGQTVDLPEWPKRRGE